MVERALIALYKHVFKTRDLRFEGLKPARVRRRIQLASGIIKDTARGKLSAKTRELLVKEVTDAIVESPFLEYFASRERERLRGLRGR